MAWFCARILYDKDTPEGRTRLQFINQNVSVQRLVLWLGLTAHSADSRLITPTPQLPKLARSPLTAPSMVRSFIDSMHDYLVTKRRDYFNRLRIDIPFDDPDSVSQFTEREGERESAWT